DLFPEVHQGRLMFNAESYVVNGAPGHKPNGFARRFHKVDKRCFFNRVCDEAVSVNFLLQQTVAEPFSQDLRCRIHLIGCSGNVVESPCGMLGFYIVRFPRGPSIRCAGDSQLKFETIGIKKCEVLLTEFFRDIVMDHACLFKPCLPEIEASGRYGIADLGNLLGAAAALPYTVTPRKKG